MAKVKIQGHASGTGILTLTAPNTSTDRTITLPDTTGTLLDENSSVPAANLTGTVADARFPATLPAASAANLTAIPAANITGTLPAIDGSNLTGLVATLSGLTDATVSASDPATDTNPSATGHLWVNKTSGECYVCTTATTDANVWTNVGSGTGDVVPPPYNVEYLVIAGGSGGYFGGGGAGGYRNSYNSEHQVAEVHLNCFNFNCGNRIYYYCWCWVSF